MRRVVLRVLEKSGAAVETATGVEDATARLDTEPDRFDLLVTDFMLEDGTGVEVAQIFREKLPQAPVLIMSGYAPPEEVEALTGEDVRFLAKPFEPEALLPAVEELVERLGRAGREGRRTSLDGPD